MVGCSNSFCLLAERLKIISLVFGIFWHDAKFSSQIARESRYGEPKDGAEHGEIARLLSMLPRFDSGLATVICGLRFLLVLALLRRFFSSFSSFPPSTKTIISQIPKFWRIEDAHVNQWAKKRIMFNYSTDILFCKPVNRIFSHCDWLHWSTRYWAASTRKIDSCFPSVTKKCCQR